MTAAIIILLSMILKVVIKLRLWPLLLYVIVVLTAFYEWQHDNQTLAMAGFILLAILIGVSWIWTITKRVRGGK